VGTASLEEGRAPPIRANLVKPSPGRIVLYQPADPHVAHPLPAIVIFVREGEEGSGESTTVDLEVFGPDGGHLAGVAENQELPEPGTWRWPPSVKVTE
jgi:hypothetical protein